MLNGKVLAIGITTVGAGLLVAVAAFVSPLRRAPMLRVVSLEPASLVDDAGVELAFLTLSISNAEAFPNQPVFVRDAGVPAKARVGGHWIEIHWPQGQVKLADCALSPFKSQNTLLLIPETAEVCRVSFKYAGAVTKTSWRLGRLAERLPTYVRLRIPHAFWRWVGFEHYGPSSKWQDGTVDVPLPTGEPYRAGA